MIAVVSLLIVVILSFLVARVGAVAFRLTGMSEDTARFQAWSALTGAGFTTTESEQVVTHPVRRRIANILMVFGNIGLVAASGTLIVSLVGIEERADMWRIAAIVGGVVGLFLIAASKPIDRLMCGAIAWALSRYTSLETRDFATLLHLRDDYRIAELLVRSTDWMAGKSLHELRHEYLGILVLGIIRIDGSYEGAPDSDCRIEVGQTLVVYGLPAPVTALDCRCASQEVLHD